MRLASPETAGESLARIVVKRLIFAVEPNHTRFGMRPESFASVSRWARIAASASVLEAAVHVAAMALLPVAAPESPANARMISPRMRIVLR